MSRKKPSWSKATSPESGAHVRTLFVRFLFHPGAYFLRRRSVRIRSIMIGKQNRTGVNAWMGLLRSDLRIACVSFPCSCTI
jgi:hypothetical protein